MQYRQAIGLFNNSKVIFSVVNVFSVKASYISLLLICLLLILLSGDVEMNPGPKQKLQYLTLCHSNVRGLTVSRLRALKTSLVNTYDIITLSETFLSATNIIDLQIPGYSFIRRDRPAFGGGLLIYIRNNISFKRIKLFELVTLENIWIEVSTNDGKLLICNIYRPPSFNDFWEMFDNNIDLVKSKLPLAKVIILGDLNSDFTTINGRKLTEICLNQNLHCLISKPTRITLNTETCLDQIITNIPNFIISTSVDPPFSSNDHCTVGVKVKFKYLKDKAYSRHIFLYERTDNSALKKALDEFKWDTFVLMHLT